MEIDRVPFNFLRVLVPFLFLFHPISKSLHLVWNDFTSAFTPDDDDGLPLEKNMGQVRGFSVPTCRLKPSLLCPPTPPSVFSCFAPLRSHLSLVSPVDCRIQVDLESVTYRWVRWIVYPTVRSYFRFEELCQNPDVWYRERSRYFVF